MRFIYLLGLILLFETEEFRAIVRSKKWNFLSERTGFEQINLFNKGSDVIGGYLGNNGGFPWMRLTEKFKTIRETFSRQKEGFKPINIFDKPNSIATRIIGGRDADKGEYPWMAALYRNGLFKCSFSIISPSWLLGAAHCVVDWTRTVFPILTFSAVVGNVNRSSPDTNVTFSHVIIHHEYSRFLLTNDIALMKLSTPLVLNENIQPICIPGTNREYRGMTGLAMGWGNTRRSLLQIPDVLQVVRIDISDHSWCQFMYGLVGFGKVYITRNQICAGSLAVGVCNGDSGGPLVVEDEGKNVTVGVTSFGTRLGCSVLGIPSVYTATSRYSDWIVKEVDEEICVVNNNA